MKAPVPAPTCATCNYLVDAPRGNRRMQTCGKTSENAHYERANANGCGPAGKLWVKRGTKPSVPPPAPATVHPSPAVAPAAPSALAQAQVALAEAQKAVTAALAAQEALTPPKTAS